MTIDTIKEHNKAGIFLKIYNKIISFNDYLYFILSVYIYTSSHVHPNFGVQMHVRMYSAINLTARACTDIITLIENGAAFPTKIFTLYSENEYLFAEIQKLKQDLYRMKYTEIENKYLRELTNWKPNLHIRDDIRSDVITTNIVASVDNGVVKRAVIDVGSQENIARGNVVVSTSGFIGRIFEVYEDHSTILLITDPLSRIPVISLESNNISIAVGDGCGGINLKYLSDNHNMKLGEVVVTSADAQEIPEGYVIGTIDEISAEHVHVKPHISWSKLKVVQVWG